MKAEELFEAIGEIDDEIIEKSEELYGGGAVAGSAAGPMAGPSAGSAETDSGSEVAGSVETAGGLTVGTPETLGNFKYVTPPVGPAPGADKNPVPKRRPNTRSFRRWYPAIAVAACLLVGLIGILPVIQRKGAAMEEAAVESAEEAFDEDAGVDAASAEAWEELEEAAVDESAEYEEAAEAKVESNAAGDAEEPAAAGGISGGGADSPSGANEAADNPVGVTLTAGNVSAVGLDLICTQSGGKVTGELQTGTAYTIEELKDEYAGAADVRSLPDDAWAAVPYAQENVGWNDVALIIPVNGQTVWNINWEAIYGPLGPGTYRISKQIMDFRGTGDYDTYTSRAYFSVDS